MLIKITHFDFVKQRKQLCNVYHVLRSIQRCFTLWDYALRREIRQVRLWLILRICEIINMRFFQISCKFSVKLEQGYHLMNWIGMKLSAEQNDVACEQALKRSAKAHALEGASPFTCSSQLTLRDYPKRRACLQAKNSATYSPPILTIKMKISVYDWQAS